MKVLDYALPNNFPVGNLLVNIDLDYVLSTNNAEEEYLLLNDNMLGNFNKESVMKLIESNKRVIVINNESMKLQSYNVEEEEMNNAFLKSIV